MILRSKGSDMNKSEQNFVDEMTRKMLVTWAHRQLHRRSIDPGCTITDDPGIYLEYAIKKGWVSADGCRVLSKGFNTAAAFLRR